MRTSKKSVVSLLMTTAVIVVASLFAWAQAADQVTIEYRQKTGQDYYFGSVEEFERQFPNIKVETTTTPGGDYHPKYLIDFAAGVAPDIIWSGDVTVGQYAARGCYLDLTPYVEDGTLTMPEIPGQNWSSFRYKGRTYAIPFDLATKAFLYNKTLFEEMGIGIPTEAWTYDDMLAAALKLTEKDSSGKVVRYGVSVRGAWWNDLFSMIFPNGGEYLTADLTKCLLGEPAAYEGIQWWADLINVHQVAPKIAATLEEPLDARFADGRLAMMLTGTPWLPILDPDDPSWDLALWPAGKAKRWTFMWSGGTAITSTTKYLDAAVEFVKFYNTPESALLQWDFATTEGLAHNLTANPALHPMWLQEVTRTYGDRNFQVMIDDISYTASPQVSATFFEETDLLTRELEPVFAGKISAEEAMAKIVPQINAILDRGI